MPEEGQKEEHGDGEDQNGKEVDSQQILTQIFVPTMTLAGREDGEEELGEKKVKRKQEEPEVIEIEKMGSKGDEKADEEEGEKNQVKNSSMPVEILNC